MENGNIMNTSGEPGVFSFNSRIDMTEFMVLRVCFLVSVRENIKIIEQFSYNIVGEQW